MKDLRAVIEQAIREGATVEDIYGAANAAQQAVIREQEREDEIAKARLAAAEALTKYLNLVFGEDTETAEEAWERFETMEKEFAGLFSAEPDPDPEEDVEIKVYEGQETMDKLTELIEKLGF